MIFIIGTAGGLLLGLRFRIFALLPASLVVAALAILSSQGMTGTGFRMFVTLVLVQAGYFAGTVLRAMDSERLSRKGRNHHAAYGPEPH
jgi:hypothetical protein